MRGSRTLNAIRGFLAAAAGCLALSAVASEAQAGDWGDPFRISQPATISSGINEAAVAADDAGNFLHAWVQLEPTGAGVEALIYAQVVRADGTNGPIQRVFNPPGDSWVSNISASRGPGGAGHLAWAEQEYVCDLTCNGTNSIRYVTLDSNGKPTSTPHLLEGISTNDGSQVSAAALDTGDNGVTRVAWFKYDAAENKGYVNAVAVPSGGSPLSPFYLHEEDSWSFVYDLDLASNGNGDTMVAWAGAPGGDTKAEGVLLGGDGFLHPVQTLATSVSVIGDIQAEIDESGRSTVAFGDQDDGYSVRARQVGSNGQVLGASPLIISTPAEGSDFISTNGLGLAPDGTATLAWNENNTPAGINAIRTRTISPQGTLGPVNDIVTESNPTYVTSAVIGSSSDGSILAYHRLPAAGPDAGFGSIFGVNLNQSGASAGPPVLLDKVPVAWDTSATEKLVMSGDDASLSWREARAEVGFYGELFGAIWDGTSPEVTLWAPTSVSVGQEILVGAEASDRSSISYEWTIDGSFPPVTSALAKHTFHAVGNKTVQVKVTDAAGNETAKETTIEVKALPDPPDPPLPPNTRITAKPKKKVKVKTATFRFASTLTGSKFECRLDKAGWTNCKSPRKLRKLKPGKHTFRVRAVKGELIDPSPAVYKWTVQKPKRKRR